MIYETWRPSAVGWADQRGAVNHAPLQLQKRRRSAWERCSSTGRDHGEAADRKPFKCSWGSSLWICPKLTSIPECPPRCPRISPRKFGVVPVRVEGFALPGHEGSHELHGYVAIERPNRLPETRDSHDFHCQQHRRAIMNLYGNEAWPGPSRRCASREMWSSRRVTAVPSLEIGDEDTISAPGAPGELHYHERAATERVSDIHIEPRRRTKRSHENRRHAHKFLTVPKDLQSSVISYFASDHGRDEYHLSTRICRWTAAPTCGSRARMIRSANLHLPLIYGEKVVIRLNKSTDLLNKAGIGLSGPDLDKYAVDLQPQRRDPDRETHGEAVNPPPCTP